MTRNMDAFNPALFCRNERRQGHIRLPILPQTIVAPVHGHAQNGSTPFCRQSGCIIYSSFCLYDDHNPHLLRTNKSVCPLFYAKKSELTADLHLAASAIMDLTLETPQEDWKELLVYDPHISTRKDINRVAYMEKKKKKKDDKKKDEEDKKKKASVDALKNC
jgi:hypothetical protein